MSAGLLFHSVLLHSSAAALRVQPWALVRSPVLVRGFAACSTAPEEEVLSGAQRRQLRALAGRLGTEEQLKIMSVRGVEFSSDYLAQIDAALNEHELIKLRLRDVGSKKEAKIIAEELASGQRAHVAQVMGHTVLLYRRRAESIGPPLVLFGEDGHASVGGA